MLRRRLLIAATAVAVIANDLPLQLLNAADWPWGGRRRGPETAVTQLAEQIDELESHIDTYGTIVAKSPDVWGQARLTKYRQEYESMMSQYKDDFTETINAAISRSDQAFLTSSLALQAAISGDAATLTQPSSRVLTDTDQTVAVSPAGDVLLGPDGQPILVTSTSQRPQGTEEVLLPPPAPAKDLNQGIAFTRTKLLREDDLQGFGSKNVALEPTVFLDQASRYLNHLHELRRINDGDDKSDAPGYALHLVRIPISVLPGEETREGYGAEVTIIARPHLHDELLPMTFRGLVINDLVDQMAFPLAKFLDSQAAKELLENVDDVIRLEPFREELDGITKTLEVVQADLCQARCNPHTIKEVVEKAVSLIKPIICRLAVLKILTHDESQILLAQLDASKEGAGKKKHSEIQLKSQRYFSPEESPGEGSLRILAGTLSSTSAELTRVAGALAQLNDVLGKTDFVVPAVAASPSRRSLQPFPPSHLLDVYGALEFLIVAKLANALKHDEVNSKHTLLLDLQKFLAEEFHAAYEYLDRNPQLWAMCSAEIHEAVRGDRKQHLQELRTRFLCDVHPPDLMREHTAAMAWMILVESALLNERLKQDIRELAASKNAIHLNTTSLDVMQFFGPSSHLSHEAKQLFNDYVNCRWPIHVVAVDPITQDQNVADSFSLRREMQLALALAFSNGRIGSDSFTRMARRLEIDMETIALNRTVVGFSHGDDTFGWRFYPRVQSPDTGGHLQTFAIDMFKGLSRDKILKENRLEPGIREVTAIVIMPSFVPYVIFDVRSNWFELTDPSEKVMTVRDSMDLSAKLTLVKQTAAECARDSHLYRDGDVHRLSRSVEQLDRRLALQTTYVQMPFENTLGGFEFFNTGVPDLAPELKGFYGEPGIRVKAAAAASNATAVSQLVAAATTPVSVTINNTAPAAATTGGAGGSASAAKTAIFLVGDHFSVHETRVIAGNKVIEPPDMRLISRQVMEISIPDTVAVVESGDRKFVDVHVATPYGISNHLLVPVVDESSAAAAVADHEAKRHFDRFKWDSADIQGCFSRIENDGKVEVTLQGTPTLVFERQKDLPAFGPHRVNVAFWIDMIDAAGNKVRAAKGTKPLTPADFKNAKAELNAGDLARQIAAALNAESNRRPNAITAIELTGFVRCVVGIDGAGTEDVLPIVRTENKITIKLVPCLGPVCCDPAPQASTSPTGAEPILQAPAADMPNTDPAPPSGIELPPEPAFVEPQTPSAEPPPAEPPQRFFAPPAPPAQQ